MSGRYIRQKPYVDDDGIFIPLKEYAPEGTESLYQCVMTKEMFVEAYNKWIKKPSAVHINLFGCADDADDWSE